MFDKKNQMDERALWIRGNVFLHSLVFTVCVLVADMFVQDTYGHWAPGHYESLLMLMTIICFVSLELIWRGVYITTPRVHFTLVFAMGGCALLLFITGCVHLFLGKMPWMEDGMLTSTAVNFFVGVLIMPIPLCSLIRWRLDARQEKAGDA